MDGKLLREPSTKYKTKMWNRFLKVMVAGLCLVKFWVPLWICNCVSGSPRINMPRPRDYITWLIPLINQLTPYLWRIRNGDREMWTQVTVVIAKGVLRVDAVRLIYHSFLDSWSYFKRVFQVEHTSHIAQATPLVQVPDFLFRSASFSFPPMNSAKKTNH